MAGPKRIGLSLLDEGLKNLISASTKIFPLLTVSDLPTTRVEDYYRITSGSGRNQVYAWTEEGGYELIGADDREVDWSEVYNKPPGFLPTAHDHDATYSKLAHKHTEADVTDLDKYTQLETDTKISELSSTLNALIVQQMALAVLKEAGKELTSNDFTTSLKDKLEALSNSATVDYATMLQSLKVHVDDMGIHVSTNDRSILVSVSGKADKSYVDTELTKKAESSSVTGHTSNTTIHVTQTNKDFWNSKSRIVVGSVEPTVNAGELWYKLF